MVTPSLVFTLVQEEHAAEVTPFGLEYGLIIWTWVVFLSLFLLLRKFAWPAILRLAEERERNITRQLEEAEQMNAEAKEALADHQRLLAGAKDEASKLVSEAKAIAEKERETLLGKAKAEQEQILERAKREIQAERERAIADLRQQAVELSLAAASRLVEHNLDDEANRKVVVDFLGSLGEVK